MHKRRKITTILATLMSIIILVLVLAGVGLLKLYYAYEEVVHTTDTIEQFMHDTSEMIEGCRYMNDQVRQYVGTTNPEYAWNYVAELNETCRRDKALESIKTYIDNDNPAIESFMEAVDESYNLMYVELRAMKITSIRKDVLEGDIPTEIKVVTLSKIEQNYDEDVKKNIAYYLVNDVSYNKACQNIRQNIDDGVNSIFSALKEQQLVSEKNMIAILVRLGLYFLALIVALISAFIHEYLLVVRTIKKFTDNISNGEKIDETHGTSEFQYLAKAYNNLSDETKKQKGELEYQAEHDPLTGLYNRTVMNKLKDKLKKDFTDIALMIVDIDYFKSINDTYGHAVGDEMLKQVAEALTNSFSKDDYVIRYGGDEFIVIVTNIDKENRQEIENKINSINENLKVPKNSELPKVSLSVGVAFADNSFSWKLIKMADTALYQTKENGRSGISFYEG